MRPFLALALLSCVTACHAHSSSPSPSKTPSAPARATSLSPPPSARDRELLTRYALGLAAFNRGDYELAAGLFAELLLDVPRDPSGDQLRHLLIQHVGWSLLGSYDLGGDPATLDRGEAMLERYLAKHEDLAPDAHGEREAIYALLAEYQLRRAGEPPPDAHERLTTLVDETEDSLLGEAAPEPATVIDDGPVRVIEVHTIPWARLDDPGVQAYFRDPRFLGPSMFDKPGEPLNPTRVLVRGRVRRAEGERGGQPTKRAYALLAAARPEAERCYEGALSRGAELLERVDLELRWDAGGLAEVAVADDHGLDPAASRCVREALRRADAAEPDAGPAEAELSLTFFVQSRRGGPGKRELDTNSFGLVSPADRGVPWIEL